MALEDILKSRWEKLARIREAGEEPYPARIPEGILAIGEISRDFGRLTGSKKPLGIAGRLMGLRYHGGAVFGDLKDFSGKIQILLRKDVLGKAFSMIENLDVGDFIFVKGRPFVTQAGENTVEVHAIALLVKSLRPIPSEWYGLADVEERFRKRYLDLIVNETVFRRFLTRARIVSALRGFLDTKGFIEVETPILQPLYGGAAAKPFRTRLDILKLDLYLRIAPELYLKRLLIGGFEKIYELGRVFRNEGIDRNHNPEFTMLELYWAYQTRDGLMDFCEELIGYLAQFAVAKKNKQSFFYQEHEISVAPPWKRVSFSDALKEAVGLDWYASSDELRRAGEAKGLVFDRNLSKGKIADEIVKKLVFPKIIQPTFIINHPVEISPLAHADPQNPGQALRYHLVMGGMGEIINGFAELNDPEEQRRRFEAQEQNRKAGDEEAQRLDEDFLEALEYGMPPAAGLGLGVDRLVALLTDAPSLKEAIAFPLLKPKD